MHEHPKFGRLIYNWQKHRSIDRKSKQMSMVLIVATLIITWFFGTPWWAIASRVAVLTCSATYILPQPLPLGERQERGSMLTPTNQGR